MRIMFTMNSSNFHAFSTLCSILIYHFLHFEYYLQHCLISMQTSPAFRKKRNCVCQTIIHLSHKSFSFPSPSKKIFPECCPYSCYCPELRPRDQNHAVPSSVCLSVSKLSPITSTGHKGSPALLNCSTATKGIISKKKKSSLSKVGSCQYPCVKQLYSSVLG